jgi:hypothetical protein
MCQLFQHLSRPVIGLLYLLPLRIIWRCLCSTQFMNEYEKLFRSTVASCIWIRVWNLFCPVTDRRDALYNSLSTVNELTAVITTHCTALNCRVLVIKVLTIALKRRHVSKHNAFLFTYIDTCRGLPNLHIQNLCLCIQKAQGTTAVIFHETVSATSTSCVFNPWNLMGQPATKK